MELSSPKRQNDLRDWIEDTMVANGLRPGDRVDERVIGRRFGVSRTPVREALLQLEALNLIEIRPRRGAVVKVLTIQEIAAIYEVRAAVEGTIAEFAAKRMTDSERAQLVAIHESSRSLVEAGLIAEYALKNQQFHDAIRAGCGNYYLANQSLMIRRRLRPYRFYQLDRAGDLRRSFDGHQRIAEAIFIRDEKTAGTVMREHVSGALPFIDLLAELPADKQPRRSRRAPAKDAPPKKKHGRGSSSTT